MIVIIIFTVLFLILGFIENRIHSGNIKRIKIRILVNGTRGKSSTVRLLNAALNHCGIKSIAKSTGSEASYILPDLSEVPINRKRGKNPVREQRALFAKAVELSCDAVVCECSAISPENQLLYAEKLVKPTLVAITNTHPDHKDQMGEDTEKVIMLSVPENMIPVMTDKQYSGSVDGFGFSAHPAAIALALEVCGKLGIDESKALEGMKKARGDIGMEKVFHINGKTVVNGFAVNDTESAKELFQGLEMQNTTVVYANRKDREYRLEEFAKLFEELGIKDICVIGDNLEKSGRILKARKYNNSQFGEMLESGKSAFVCCGNIVGSGADFIKFCLEHKE